MRSSFGLTLCLLALLGFIHVQAPFSDIGTQREQLGGAIGFMVSFPLLAFTSLPVAYVVLSALLLIGFLVIFEMGIGDVLRALRPEKEKEEEAQMSRSQKA